MLADQSGRGIVELWTCWAQGSNRNTEQKWLQSHTR